MLVARRSSSTSAPRRYRPTTFMHRRHRQYFSSCGGRQSPRRMSIKGLHGPIEISRFGRAGSGCPRKNSSTGRPTWTGRTLDA